MQLALDLTGRRVLVVGTASGARRVLARYRAAGAVVSRTEEPGTGPSAPTWSSG